jgi:hypothetical protein
MSCAGVTTLPLFVVASASRDLNGKGMTIRDVEHLRALGTSRATATGNCEVTGVDLTGTQRTLTFRISSGRAVLRSVV